MRLAMEGPSLTTRLVLPADQGSRGVHRFPKGLSSDSFHFRTGFATHGLRHMVFFLLYMDQFA